MTKTVTYAKYQQVGKWVVVIVQLAATGSGSANNKVTVSLPVTAVSSMLVLGSADIVDASAVTNNPGVVTFDSTTTVSFVDCTQATSALRLGQTGTVFAAALASTDVVSFMACYEAA